MVLIILVAVQLVTAVTIKFILFIFILGSISIGNLNNDSNDSDEEEEEEEEESEEEDENQIFNRKKVKKKKKMTEFEYKNIKKYSSIKEKKCCICLEKYKSSDIIKEYPCKHIFHKSCIFKWLKESNLCPICKHDISKAVKKVKISKK